MHCSTASVAQTVTLMAEGIPAIAMHMGHVTMSGQKMWQQRGMLKEQQEGIQGSLHLLGPCWPSFGALRTALVVLRTLLELPRTVFWGAIILLWGPRKLFGGWVLMRKLR